MKLTKLQPGHFARQSENGSGDYARDRWQWLKGETIGSIAAEARKLEAEDVETIHERARAHQAAGLWQPRPNAKALKL